MTIDTSGKWWKGTDSSDIEAYLRELQPGGYSVDKVIQARCGCGSTVFRLNVDQDNELAQTVCVTCGRASFVSDSEEHWAEASPRLMKCPAKHKEYEVVLGLCVRDEEWVRWMSLGSRCVRCGILASPLDWKSDLQLADTASTRIA